MTIEKLYSIFLQYPSVQTDTRKIKKSDLFFALKGPNFNGNLFAEKAIEQGAAYVIVDEDIPTANEKYILVNNVLTTLQDLAKYHRQQFTIPFIAITGSNGKTTSKELVSAVLATTYKTYTTQGNLNNHIGIPLTILSVQKDAEIAVIEMGANHQKEIESYCTYTLPTHGTITNCGKAHLEGFGGVEGVKKGKGELFDYLKYSNGVAFIFDDYDYFHTMSNGIKNIVWYGTNNGVVQGHVVNSEPFLQIQITSPNLFTIQSNLVGDYNMPNMLMAATIGKYFNVTNEKIKAAIEAYAPSNSRSQLIEKEGNKFIVDAYNANPTSMKAAIENFAKIHADKKVLLLGGMMEMGDAGIEEHTTIVQLLQQFTWENVVLVGGDFNKVPHNYIYFNNSTEAKVWLQQQHFSNTHLLVKGSRSMQMEKVLED